MSITASTRYGLPSNVEYQGKYLGSYNRITAIEIPPGITAYISDQESFDVDNSEHLTDVVNVKQNNKFADPINLYLHTFGTVADDEIKLDLTVVSAEGVYFENEKLQTIALENDVKESLLSQNIKSFDNALLAELDKIINPYNLPIISQGYTSSTSGVTMLNKTLNCDKIRISLNIVAKPSSYNGGSGVIWAELNGITFFNLNNSNGDGSLESNQREITVSRGDTLTIYSNAAVSNIIENTFYLEEYTLNIH